MDKSTLLELINNPGNISENDLENLEEIVSNHPYCHVAHLLIAKYTKDKESMLAPQKIRRGASYAYNRNIFRKLIQSNYSLSKPADAIRLKTQIEEIDTEVFAEEPLNQDENSIIQSETDTDKTEIIKSFFVNLDNLEVVDETAKEEEINLIVEDNTIIAEEKTYEKSKIEKIDESIVNENAAMILYNEGREEEAIAMYKKLIQVYPEKRGYYRSQLSILTGDDSYLFYDEEEHELHIPLHEPGTIAKIQSNTENSVKEGDSVNSFFENLSDNLGLKEPEKINQLPLSEESAMHLFNTGKEAEAIEMYQELIRLQPEKKGYYSSQLALLADDDAYLNNTDTDDDRTTTSLTENRIDDSFEKLKTDFNEIENELSETNDTKNPEENNSKSFFDEINEPDEEKQKETESSFFDNINENQTTEKLPDYDIEAIMVSNEKYGINQVIEDEDTYFREEPDDIHDENNTSSTWIDEDYLDPLEQIYENQSPEPKPETSSEKDEEPEAILDGESIIQKYLQEEDVAEEKDYPTISDDEIEVLKNTSSTKDTNEAEINAEENESNALSESEAILFFNQGKIAEAIDIYENLIFRNPQKASYYMSQISVLKKKDIEISKQIEDKTAEEEDKKTAELATEAVSERMAILLFNQGRTEEAIKVYEQLLLLFPEKRAYFASQIEILKS